MMRKQSKRTVETRTKKFVSSTPRVVSTTSFSRAGSSQLDEDSSSFPSPLSSSAMSTSMSTTTRSSTSSSRSSSKSFVRQENERKEMISLNDRLAKYIDLVNKIDLDSSRAQFTDVSFMESRQRAMTEIREIFEKELDDARRLHAEDRERLERECAKYKSELSDLNPR